MRYLGQQVLYFTENTIDPTYIKTLPTLTFQITIIFFRHLPLSFDFVSVNILSVTFQFSLSGYLKLPVPVMTSCSREVRITSRKVNKTTTLFSYKIHCLVK